MIGGPRRPWRVERELPTGDYAYVTACVYEGSARALADRYQREQPGKRFRAFNYELRREAK